MWQTTTEYPSSLRKSAPTCFPFWNMEFLTPTYASLESKKNQKKQKHKMAVTALSFHDGQPDA